MPWTWVTDDFNRSDRLLDGDNVGASALKWQHWNSTAPAVNAPRIISNVPGINGTQYGVQWLATDVAPVAGGAPILGVGAETYFVSERTTDSGSNYYGEVFAAIGANFTGDMVWVQTAGLGRTAQVYRSTVTGSVTSSPATTTGFIGVGGVTTRSANISSTSLVGDSFGAWGYGTAVRLEVVYGGNTTVFYNGTAAIIRPTPASVAGNTIVAGNMFRSYWNHDTWRVGVLT